MTAEEVADLFPEAIGDLERASLRAGYRADRYPFVEAEYGEGSEGPVGGGRTGSGVSLLAGLVPPNAPDPAEHLGRTGAAPRDTTYAGHRAHRFSTPAGGAGVMVVLEGSPRAAVTVVSRGEGVPGPFAVLELFAVERLAELAGELRSP